MRLSVITDEISPDLGVALRACESMDVSAVELRSVGGRNLVHHDLASARHACAAVSAGGFTCPVVDTPFLKTPIDEVAWPDLERGFELAHLVGAETIRVFSTLRPQAGPPNSLRRITDLLAAAVDRAANVGLRLAMEIEHACSVALGAEAVELLTAPELEPLGVVWDPGNEARFLGRKPDPGPIAELGPAIYHVHVKDADPDRWVRLGTGVVDWPEQLTALKAIGYDGFLSMETHYELPGGGEPATRESVLALRELTASVGIELS
jgi:L-ribulose-5-phosphate 3-epimerase